jgi:hypothetical protein
MLYVYDEFPSIKSDKVRYSFGISYEDKSVFSKRNYIDVSLDNKLIFIKMNRKEVLRFNI